MRLPPLMVSDLYRKAALTVFFLAFLVRIYHLNVPFVEPYNNLSRQAICATVVRNFYQHGFNFFYPEIDENGSGPYLYNAEMPIYSYLMALGYAITGGVQEGVARSLTVFSSMVMLLCLYLLFKRLFDERLALWSLVFASFTPLGVALSRSVQPDMTMLSASVVALYTFYRYFETQKIRFYLCSMLAMFLAIATKIYALHLFLPMLYIAWHFQKKKAFFDIKNYLFLLITASALGWYGYMAYRGKAENLIYTPYAFVHARGPADQSYFDLLFSARYLKTMAKIFFVHLLTIGGSGLFLLGVFRKIRTFGERVFLVWTVSLLIYIFVFWRIVIDHSYYQLPLIPVLAFFIARGTEIAFSNQFLKKFSKNSLVVCITIAVTLFNLLYFYKGLYFIPASRAAIVEAGQAVEDLVPKDSLVVASYATSTIQLYYCNRKGWAFDVVSHTDTHFLIQQLEDLRAKHASYFVTSEKQVLHQLSGFEDYLRQRYPVVKETSDFVIFHL